MKSMKMYMCYCSLDTSVITLAQRVESTGMGGDKSINSPYSQRLLTISSIVKEWEKGKDKEKKSRSDFENKRKMKQRWTKKLVKTIRKMIKEFEIDF